MEDSLPVPLQVKQEIIVPALMKGGGTRFKVILV